MKTFEACGFKVPQLVDYRPGLDNFFEPDKEIMIFSSIEEYKEKLEMLEKDKSLRNLLVKNSYKKENSEGARVLQEQYQNLTQEEEKNNCL